MATQTLITQDELPPSQNLHQLFRGPSDIANPAGVSPAREFADKCRPDRPNDEASGQYSGRIVFKSRGRMLMLPVTDIRWIAAEENYVRICTGSETHLLRETMTAMEQKLNPRQFLRVHRSSIVNLRYVKEVRSESRGDFMVHLVTGHKVAMSRSYRARLGDFLNRS